LSTTNVGWVAALSDVNEQDLNEFDEEEDAEELGEDEEIDAAEFDADLDEEELDDYDDDSEVADVELSPKEQNARSLAIRRAIEQRMERRRLDEDLDYLDLGGDE
jgi:hypothetical protein